MEHEPSAVVDTTRTELPTVSGHRVRPASAADVEQIRELAVSNGLFPVDEMSGFDDMLAGYLDGTLEGHQWIVLDDGAPGVAAAAYFAPEPFADRVWNLYFIAARRGEHRGGAGTELITYVERTLRAMGADSARVLIVETSSLDAFADARAFYDTRGFVEEARIREYYGPGDDKVVFWKSLTTPEPGGRRAGWTG